MYVKSNMALDIGAQATILDTDIDEFMSICQMLRNHSILSTTGELTNPQISAMITNRVIPCIMRGKDTNHIFEHYKVQDNYITVLLDDATEIEEIFRASGGRVESLI